MDRLDTQVSNLHQDVAVLSIEVRNAIQALQEMSTPSKSNPNLTQRYPTHSNPNIQENGQWCGAKKKAPMLERSSSQPPDMFCWDDDDNDGDVECNDNQIVSNKIKTICDQQTQTDEQLLIQFVGQNQTLLRQILSLGNATQPQPQPQPQSHTTISIDEVS